jgi:hypothetical protein
MLQIGDLVKMQRYGESEHFGYVIGYDRVKSTGGILCKIQWFDGLTSSEYLNMVKKVSDEE